MVQEEKKQSIMRTESSLICTLIFIAILLIYDSSTTTTAQDLSSCESHCGRIAIPYPFGIGEGCYLNNDKWYEVICNTTSRNPVPFLSSINREIVNISLPDSIGDIFGHIRIKNPVTSLGCSNKEELSLALNLTGSPFFLTAKNTLVAVGCNNKALMTDIKPQIGGCESTCDVGFSRREHNISCDGYKCCQAKLPSDRLQQIGIKIESLDDNKKISSGCRVAFLTDETYSPSNITEPELFYSNKDTTVELGWFIDMSHNMSTNTQVCYSIFEGRGSYGYSNYVSCICEYGSYLDRSFRSCRCNRGYKGNPYLSTGCTDIDECEEAKAEGRNPCEEGDDCVNMEGSLQCKPQKHTTLNIILGIALVSSIMLFASRAWWLFKIIREIKRKKKLVKLNEGLLMQQQLTSIEGNVELEKATELELSLIKSSSDDDN